MSEEEIKAKKKVYFPEDVETIMITKNDYDRLYGDLTYQNIKLQQENKQLKQKLNWIAFGDDSELALRYLRKIGYVDFDEERKVYINKHNNEPFYLDEEEEKDYYIKDDELNEYTQQLEYKFNKKQEQLDLYKSVIDEIRELLKNPLNYHKRGFINELQEILDKASIKESE